MSEMPDLSPTPPADLELAKRAFESRPFSDLKDRNAPSLLIDISDLGIVWANRAAANLFEVASYDALQRRVAGRSAMSGARLAGLVRGLRAVSAPRLERLRFNHGVSAFNLTALCWTTEIRTRSLLVLAFLGPEADSAKQDTSWTQGVEDDTPPVLDAAIGRVPADPARPVSGPSSTLSPPPLFGTPDEQEIGTRRSALQSEFSGSVARFVWRTDADGVLVQLDDRLTHVLQTPLYLDAEVGFADQVARFDPEAGERLDGALSDRATWSGIDMLCPVANGTAALPLSLSGSPQFDNARRFVGFRGFGRLDLARLTPRTIEDSASGPIVSGQDRTLAPSAPIAQPTMIQDVREAVGPSVSESKGLRMPDAAELNSLRIGAYEPSIASDRSANVVQLWPAHSTPIGRGQHQLPKSPSPASDQDGAAEFGSTDAELRSSIEAAVERSLERGGDLTTTEYQAFQEIGRALEPGPRQGTPADPALDAGSAAPPDAGVVSELDRHAATLVENMSVGLLVMRGPRVIFANDALREVLRYQSHAELLDALTIHATHSDMLGSSLSSSALVLPSAYGDLVGFHDVTRDLAWNSQPAVLHTLTTPDDIADHTPAPVAVPTMPSSPHPDAPDPTAILDAAGEAIALIDPEGRLLRLNRQGERYFGRDRGGVDGDDFTRLLAPESRAAATALLHRLKADPRPNAQARGECVGRSAEGASLVLEMRLVRLDAPGYAVVWRDLSAQRALERDLAHARRQAARAGDQQPDFLANVSHQVRTPLNAILGFAEIMMDERFGPLGNPRYKDYLADIHTSGTQVITMIDDLTNLSRIETGRLDLRLEAVDINKVIGECVHDAQGLAHRERVIVRTSFAARLPPILADERSARQIVGNLLSNAIKFNEPGGQVIVSTAVTDGASVVVRIRDTGIGMTDGEISSALEPFRHLVPTKSTSGSGLGLPLTKALVGVNGASLSMRSNPKEGTMVEVTFQATTHAPARVPA